MKATRVCIVRHGETDWNAARRIQGQIDIPLNAAGRTQAAAAAAGLARFRFEAVYSSDLARTWQTAEPIAAACGLQVAAAPGLRERHYGRMQGMTTAEARERLPDLHAAYVARELRHDFDGGETLIAFSARVTTTLNRLAGRHRGAAVLLVSHGGVLDIVHRLATGRDLAVPRDFPIPNAGLNWIAHDGVAWRLLSWAGQDHLAAALDEVAG